MNTSIQITKGTLEKLKRLKKIRKVSTYDDLINELINKAQNIPDTIFSIDKGKIKKFSKEDRIAFQEMLKILYNEVSEKNISAWKATKIAGVSLKKCYMN